jgi:hypothetical protein
MIKSTPSRYPDLLQNIVCNLSEGIYAITGICKNAGKTSLLNHIIPYFTGKALGIMTTGRDGEATDAVSGNQKPGVQLPAEVLFTTVSPVLEALGSALQIIDKLPYQAGTQPLWLAKTLREAEVEIRGAATVSAQTEIAHLMQQAGAEVVLIDGSIDRKSIALSSEIKGLFLVAGSSFGNPDKIRREVERLYQLSQITMYPEQFEDNLTQKIMYLVENQWYGTEIASLLEQEQCFLDLLAEYKPAAVFLPGALTDSVLAKIKPALKTVGTLVIRHPLQLHIHKTALDALLRELDVYAVNTMNLLCLALNSWSVKGEHQNSATLRSDMRRLLPGLPVVDIREGWSNENKPLIGDDFDR